MKLRFLKNLFKEIIFQRASRWIALSSGFFVVSCTAKTIFESEEFIFNGLEKVSINADGSLVLNWAKVPASELQYQVFRRSVSQEFNWTAPYETVPTTTTKFPSYSLNEKYCFSVRFEATDKAPDKNTNQICPELPYLEQFSGIHSVKVSGLGAVTVTWTPPSNVDHLENFGVYLGTGFDTLVATVDANQTSAVVGGLAVDSTYTFGVRAIDSYSRTDTNKKTMSVQVINNSPLTFKGIEKVTQSSATSVVVDWPAPAGIANEFRIFRWSGAPGDTPVVDFNSPATTAAGTLKQTTISNLGDEQKHCFGVRSVSSGSQEDLNTATQCLTFPDNGAPVFAGLQTTQFSGGAAVLNWNAAVGETAKYRVYYQEGTSLNFSTATMVEVAAPAVTHSLTGLPDNRSWTFAVRAVDSRNQIDSNTVTRTSFAGDLTAPSFLGYAGAELVADSETQLTVTFNRSTDIDMSHYSIRGRLTGSGATFMELTTITQQGAGPISKTITGLLPATSYDILVKAVDTSGNPSTNTSFKTRATLDQTPPTFNGITSVGAAPGDISKTRVQWNAATDAGGIKEYRVYYSTQSLVGKTLVRTATYPLNVSGQIINMSTAITSGTQADIMALTENTNYYFVVHAIDNADNEDTNTSQQQYTVPFYTPPAAPTGLAFSAGAGPSSNRYPFVTGNSTAGYKVKIYVDDVAVSTTAINSTGAFSIQLSLANTTGNYVVKAAHLNPSDVEGVSDTVGTYQLVVDTPVATITGAPTESSMSNATALNVTVGGSNVTQYKFAMLTQATACNATINNYSVTWTDVATPITASTGADGAKRLCVIAKNSGGFEQDITAATERNWTKNTTPPAAPTITAVSDPVTNSTSETYNGVVNVTVSSVAAATHYCAKGNTSEPAAPAAGDSCWTASTTLAATLTGSGGTTTANTIYAWSKDSASNISTSASTSAGTIDYVNICDSGNLATTCTISTLRTLASGGATIGGQGSLLVVNGGTLEGAALETFNVTLIGNLTINNGGTLNGNFSVSAANINLQAGGLINANSKGYVPNPGGAGNGPGGGEYALAENLQCGGGGGGHGGAGGDAVYEMQVPRAQGGPANGSLTSPTSFGSSGGAAQTASSVAGGDGGAGGGAVKLVATGAITINGNITANGAASLSGGANRRGGGGAGGSIWIVSNLLSGSGTLRADGGDVAGLCTGGTNPGNTFLRTGAGTGAGGRVSISSASPFFGVISVAAGGGIDLGAGVNFIRGDQGTLYTNYTNICDSGSLSTTCVVSSSLVLGESFAIAGSGSLVVNGSISTYKHTATLSIAMTGDVTVQNGGSISANLTTLSASNLTIEDGAVVSANSLGSAPYFAYKSASGGTQPGGSITSATSSTACVSPTGGGAHGGWGGDSSSGVGIGSSYMGNRQIYGVDAAPVTLGSAGGSCSRVNLGGYGGGRISMTVTGTLTVNGSLLAEGGLGNSRSGGGAGGSLNLQVNAIAGTGVISAAGGNGNGSSGIFGGGGGGGRIALSSSNKFNGTISVVGGAGGGSGATDGSPGYAHFTNKDNYCSSGSLSSGTCTISGKWRLNHSDSLSGVNLTIANGGSLSTFPTEQMSAVTLSGDFTIQSGGLWRANVGQLSANNISVEFGGSINLNGHGYQGYYGLISGTGPVANSGGKAASGSGGGSGGGGHGGTGGSGNTPAAGGIGGVAYDSASNPVHMGAAGSGHGHTSSTGGSGGGYIFLDASGTVTISGTLSADGTQALDMTGNNHGGGGGAGGGIKIEGASLAGSGNISALGGRGANTGSRGGGGGGGGIIFISVSSSTHSGTVLATGGAAGIGAGLDGFAGSDGLVTP